MLCRLPVAVNALLTGFVPGPRDDGIIAFAVDIVDGRAVEVGRMILGTNRRLVSGCCPALRFARGTFRSDLSGR